MKTQINKTFLEKHNACKGMQNWWLKNGLDFVVLEDLKKKVIGDYKGYVEWLQNIENSTYDKNGNGAREYNKNGDMISHTNSAGKTETWGYKNGNMVRHTDFYGNTQTWGYKNGNMTRHIDFGGDTEIWGDNNLLSCIDINGDTTLFEHDEKGNVINSSALDGTNKTWAFKHTEKEVSVTEDGKVILTILK